VNESLILSSSQAARPVLTLSQETREYLDGLTKRVSAELAKPIESASEFAQRSADLNALHKAWKVINDERLRQGRLYDEEKESNVNAVAKPWLDKLAELKVGEERLMREWDAKVTAERKRVEAEQAAERAKALQLAQEAEARKEAAAKAVEKASTPAQFDKAATAFDVAIARDLESTELLISAGSAPMPEEAKAKGSKGKDKVMDLRLVDISKLPLAYHMMDEAKVRKHILDGVLDASHGISYRIEKGFSATGR
jgi:hypothetical protein